MTLSEAVRVIRKAVKDKPYRSTSLGPFVGRYLGWFRNEYGATPSMLRDYEAVLARMSITLADKESIDVSVDDLPDVIDLGRALASDAPEGDLGHPRLLDLGRGAGPHRDIAGGAFAIELRRVSGIDAPSQALGHAA